MRRCFLSSQARLGKMDTWRDENGENGLEGWKMRGKRCSVCVSGKTLKAVILILLAARDSEKEIKASNHRVARYS